LKPPSSDHARVPGIFGIGYFVLSGLAFVLAPPLPPPGGDPAVTAAFHATNAWALRANATITTFAALCLVVFLGGLRGRLSGNRTWAAAGTAAGGMGATLVVAFAGVSAAVGPRAASPESIQVAIALHDVAYVGAALAGGAFGIAAFAYALAIRTTRALPAGLAPGGFAAALALLGGVASVGLDRGPIQIGSPLSLFGYAIWTFWVAAAATALWIIPPPTAPRPLPLPGASE